MTISICSYAVCSSCSVCVVMLLLCVDYILNIGLGMKTEKKGYGMDLDSSNKDKILRT